MSYKLAQDIREHQRERHQAWARARKVALCVALAPIGATREQNAAYAAEMERWTQEQRDRWADAAGTRTPSPESWALVVEVVRTRSLPIETQGDAHARAVPFLKVLGGGLLGDGGGI